jgi:hypothetical protein
MSGGATVKFDGVLASGASTVTNIDLSYRGWRKVYLEVPSLSTNAEVAIFGSSDGSTFRAIHNQVQTASVQQQALAVQSSSNNAIVEIPFNMQYLQLRCSATVDDGATFTVICSD